MKSLGQFAVYFFILGRPSQFSFRRLHGVPRNDDVCVFNEKRFIVKKIEWCLDDDATEHGTRINIELVQSK